MSSQSEGTSVMPQLSSAELQAIAQRIRSLRKRATEHAIEIGRELIGVKAHLPHGEFVKWVEAHCGFKIRMAQDLMKLAREAAANPNLAAIMTPSTLRVYMSNRTRPGVRDLVNARAMDGQRLSRKELLTAIADTQVQCAPSKNRAEIKSSLRQPAKADLLTAGEIGAEAELEKSRRVAELLLRRLREADVELIMDGMTWGVWNRVLVWLRADPNASSKAGPTTPGQEARAA